MFFLNCFKNFQSLETIRSILFILNHERRPDTSETYVREKHANKFKVDAVLYSFSIVIICSDVGQSLLNVGAFKRGFARLDRVDDTAQASEVHLVGIWSLLNYLPNNQRVSDLVLRSYVVRRATETRSPLVEACQLFGEPKVAHFLSRLLLVKFAPTTLNLESIRMLPSLRSLWMICWL